MEKDFLKKYGEAAHCPVRNVIDRIGDKWSVLVLMVLEEGNVLRFNEIWGSIQTISQKMLAVTLKTLEADGLVKRTVYPQIPPKVEYQLTERGKSLLPHLHGLVGWANENMGEIKESRELFGNISRN
ncbi:transcriptional regulator, HxlR family [Aquipluma nitroreducens]|uniref:Transcriptional regulator, HxlR family n=1 Tax=Aquipluma nitroreducens TaxID=2010828 RepID=A0A5K7SD20_9BACT|nr:helix-turn-helix domain-containing protein [Aquipluma nitroreducens]BBE19501.1 transcriptional regulator, HxlR family [Aquipluma nitroreducens]